MVYVGFGCVSGNDWGNSLAFRLANIEPILLRARVPIENWWDLNDISILIGNINNYGEGLF